MTAANPDMTNGERTYEGATPPRRLLRSRANRVFAGVCAGVADYFGGDPTMVRLATVILAIVTGIVPMVVVYIAAAIVIPERGGAMPQGASDAATAAPAVPGQGALLLGVLLIGVGAIALANQLFRIDWDLLWPIVLVVAGGALLVSVYGRRT